MYIHVVSSLNNKLYKESFLLFAENKNRNTDPGCNITPEMGSHTCCHTFRGLDRHSFSWVSFPFFWKHKNLVLFPLDIGFDCLQAKSHFENNNIWWCCLTVLFICLPNILCLTDLVVKSLEKTPSTKRKQEKSIHWIKNTAFYLFFLQFITFYR